MLLLAIAYKPSNQLIGGWKLVPGALEVPIQFIIFNLLQKIVWREHTYRFFFSLYLYALMANRIDGLKFWCLLREKSWICLCACLLGVQNILRLGEVIVAAHYCCCFDVFMLDTSIPILFATLFTFIHFLHSFTRIDDLLCLMFVVAVRQGTVCFSVQWFPVVHYSNDTPFHREGVPTRCQRLLVQNVQRGIVIKT